RQAGTGGGRGGWALGECSERGWGWLVPRRERVLVVGGWWGRWLDVRQGGHRKHPVSHQPPTTNHQPALMLSLIQRVTQASVSVDGEDVGRIDAGLLALVGIEPGDGQAQVGRMATRLLGHRVFADGAGRMNRSLADSGGGLPLPSQLSLAGDTGSGRRPGFSTAAAPDVATRVCDLRLAECRGRHAGTVASGRFGAPVQVALVNDGPVTFLLRAWPGRGRGGWKGRRVPPYVPQPGRSG